MKARNLIPLVLGIVGLFFLQTCKEDSPEPEIKLPSLATSAISQITASSALAGGIISSDGGSPVTSRGICWATSANPTIINNKTLEGSGTGRFSSSLTGLAANTTYYVRAYATNASGTAYGNQEICTTLDGNSLTVPGLTTTGVTAITNNSASSGGNVTSDGGASVTARGVCWNTSGNPTTANSKTTNGTGTGSYTSSITGLAASTTYYVRAYATNSQGTAYGNVQTFTTSATTTTTIPTLSTLAITHITEISASSGGNISNDGGVSVTVRGVCWNSSGNPTTANSKTTNGTGTGSFTSSLTGLAANTKYYVRAYATNSKGTAYGNQIEFTTSAPSANLANLTTSNVTSITTNSALSGGNISNDGGASVTARGVCWNTSGNPTTSNTKTSDGSGTGSFTSNVTGLTASTTYYIRAYATNSAGTAYGNQLTFTTNTNLTIPNKPTNLVANATNPTTVQLNWEDNSDNETGFEIKRFYEPLGMYMTVTSVGPNTNSYTHTNLSSTWQGYIVTAFNSAGSSGTSNVAKAPAKIRLINDLYSTTSNAGNDWYKLNKIVRVRIGPTANAVENDANNTYEKLSPVDYEYENVFPTKADWINPAYQSTSKYKDFPVSTYDLGPEYYIYAQCGWWEYVVISPPYYWTKRVSQVLDVNGQCCIYKWAWVQIINHESGYLVLKASEMGLPAGSWNGTVRLSDDGIKIDARKYQ